MIMFYLEKPTQSTERNTESIKNFGTDLTNTAKLVIIITSVWITMALLGFGLICYCVRQRYNPKKRAGNQQDPLSYVTLAPPIRLYDNVSIHYLERQNLRWSQ